MWTNGAELGLGTLTVGRECRRRAIGEVPGEQILKCLELVPSGYVLEVWLEEGWELLPLSPPGNGRDAYLGGGGSVFAQSPGTGPRLLSGALTSSFLLSLRTQTAVIPRVAPIPV